MEDVQIFFEIYISKMNIVFMYNKITWMPLVALTAGVDQEVKNWEKLDLEGVAKCSVVFFVVFFKGILKGLQENME